MESSRFFIAGKYGPKPKITFENVELVNGKFRSVQNYNSDRLITAIYCDFTQLTHTPAYHPDDTLDIEYNCLSTYLQIPLMMIDVAKLPAKILSLEAKIKMLECGVSPKSLVDSVPFGFLELRQGESYGFKCKYSMFICIQGIEVQLDRC